MLLIFLKLFKLRYIILILLLFVWLIVWLIKFCIVLWFGSLVILLVFVRICSCFWVWCFLVMLVLEQIKKILFLLLLLWINLLWNRNSCWFLYVGIYSLILYVLLFWKNIWLLCLDVVVLWWFINSLNMFCLMMLCFFNFV